MSKQISVGSPIYNLLPTEIEGFDSLAELALDMRWSWNHATDEVWRQLDPGLWEITNNPWVVLQTASRDRIERVLGDPVFRTEVDSLVASSRQAAYTPEVGWALGDGREHGDDPAWDDAEAGALYDLLEREVIPEFYTRDASGIPTAWVKQMRERMARLTPRFSANRAVREYTEQHYLPAATAYHLRIANKGAIGRQMVDWQHSLEQKWATVHFGEVKAETRGEQHVFEVQVYLNQLDPNGARVELYANGVNGDGPVRQEMKCVRQLAGTDSGYAYSGRVPATRPATDYTARLIPHYAGVAVPLEATQILWQ